VLYPSPLVAMYVSLLFSFTGKTLSDAGWDGTFTVSVTTSGASSFTILVPENTEK